MPTYEFRCPQGHTFDRMMKMSEAVAELACPECGEPAARQMSGGAGLVFKGSGFYLTDYGRNAHRTSGSGGNDKSGGDKSGNDKSGGDKSGGDKSGGDKAAGDKASGDRSSGASSTPPSAPPGPSTGGSSTGAGGSTT